eukprot:UN20629
MTDILLTEVKKGHFCKNCQSLQIHFIQPFIDNVENQGKFQTFQTKQLKMSSMIWFRGTPDCVRLNTNTHAYKYVKIRSSLTHRARRT